jgi:enoyl-[acyl-carrier protein] reductase/trans-2-enoyl-CoA reductase (NAD+)
MVIQPKVRGFICLTSHPKGCEQNVVNQINYVKSKGKIDGPKRVLVVGSSTGFGLASRVTSAFGCGASTIGVFLEKPSLKGKPASPGWYNSAAFEKQAAKEGLYAKSINGDAFSHEIKQEAFDLIKKDLGQVDLVIYSLASPVRTNPNTGVTHRSALKPIGQKFSNKTVNFHTGEVTEVSIDPANQDDIDNTVAVMGGEDWEMWISGLKENGLLADGATTVAYSYIGPGLTEAVYRKGTIGRAKDHLESTAHGISAKLKDINGSAYVSVNKALVTQASSAIPVIPLYISLLYKIMKKDGIHEGCIEQMQRLYEDRLFSDKDVPVDDKGRIRIDDWEMRDDVQEQVSKLWDKSTTESLPEIGDLEGYNKDFFNLFGFKLDGVDYDEDVEVDLKIPSIR